MRRRVIAIPYKYKWKNKLNFRISVKLFTTAWMFCSFCEFCEREHKVDIGIDNAITSQYCIDPS